MIFGWLKKLTDQHGTSKGGEKVKAQCVFTYGQKIRQNIKQITILTQHQ